MTMGGEEADLRIFRFGMLDDTWFRLSRPYPCLSELMFSAGCSVQARTGGTYHARYDSHTWKPRAKGLLVAHAILHEANRRLGLVHTRSNLLNSTSLVDGLVRADNVVKTGASLCHSLRHYFRECGISSRSYFNAALYINQPRWAADLCMVSRDGRRGSRC
jgi:hypothetical protein